MNPPGRSIACGFMGRSARRGGAGYPVASRVMPVGAKHRPHRQQTILPEGAGAMLRPHEPAGAGREMLHVRDLVAYPEVAVFSLASHLGA